MTGTDSDIDLDSAVGNIEQYSTRHYWSTDFWNQRYANDFTHYEWLAPWSLFEDRVSPHLKNCKTALDVGCGTSHLARCLVDSGFQKVVGLDFSDTLIPRLRERNRSESRIEFQVGDATGLRFQGKTFDAVFDKGTLDCICSGPEGENTAQKAVREASRVLKTNGIYVVLSDALRGGRVDLLTRKSGFVVLSKWQVEDNSSGYPPYCLYVLRKTRDV